MTQGTLASRQTSFGRPTTQLNIIYPSQILRYTKREKASISVNLSCDPGRRVWCALVGTGFESNNC